MSSGSGPGRPPVSTRFGKGQSGNPKGRPRKERPKTGSAFDIVIDRTLTVTQGGVPRDVSLEEALQHQTYCAAIAGSRPARREVLKMIAKREQAIAARESQRNRRRSPSGNPGTRRTPRRPSWSSASRRATRRGRTLASMASSSCSSPGPSSWR